MSKILCFLLLASFNVYSGDSFKLWDREIVFESTIESFSETFPEFFSNSELSTTEEKVMTYKITNNQSGEIREMNLNVHFQNNTLIKFFLHSNISDGSDQPLIDLIIKQFKYVPPKEKIDEEEMGDVVEEYKKGNLKAFAFIGGFYQLTIEQK
ncbi:MAG: hypothetical protein K8I03_11840 [Ignavibacteria bacterium]|nr:hypothetical protein [Ignavibacteria bacterium]